ncbi:uncharacterized protein [Aegilops tauschii subsp. strangulata]|uniref:Uncharacterized protein n=1 Tax=Aegilops tauschii subsp. strangulata TaxID=200361 RepID=A0A453DE84_AEGTS|nr:uncharacterized protein LOC109732766 [Aegilops tauschii subsp. strangulata]
MQAPVTPAGSVSTGETPLQQPPVVISRSPSAATTTRRRLLVSVGGLLLVAAASNNASRRAAAAAVDSYDPVTEAERAASEAVSQRVGEAVQLLEAGRELQARGEFAGALASFTAVVSGYKELALSEYARVGRALVLYEIGDRDESITEMEDVSVALKGYPEIHAALAVALYADKHAPLLAEFQFNIATLLDPHYSDLAYVRDTKHWPPSLVASLNNFITLT